MIRRPPRSTRTDTLFPYPTLFRSMRSISRSASTNGACVAAPAHEPGDCRPMRPLKNLCEVAVIGGGLAGLTAAHHAARLGALVTLFEDRKSTRLNSSH